jgi:hypothetical protein
MMRRVVMQCLQKVCAATPNCSKIGPDDVEDTASFDENNRDQPQALPEPTLSTITVDSTTIVVHGSPNGHSSPAGPGRFQPEKAFDNFGCGPQQFERNVVH